LLFDFCLQAAGDVRKEFFGAFKIFRDNIDSDLNGLPIVQVGSHGDVASVFLRSIKFCLGDLAKKEEEVAEIPYGPVFGKNGFYVFDFEPGKLRDFDGLFLEFGLHKERVKAEADSVNEPVDNAFDDINRAGILKTNRNAMVGTFKFL